MLDKNKRYLLICESPNKVKSISSILKELGYNNIVVMASVGHITKINDSGLYNSALVQQGRQKLRSANSGAI